MGFYECIYDCGDNNYCVNCASSLDNYRSPPSWLIICDKHKLAVGQTWKSYSLGNFIGKYSKLQNQTKWKPNYQVNVIDFVPYKNFHLVKLEVDGFNILGLDESKQVYFSQFSDEPAWSISNGKIILIDMFIPSNIIRVANTNRDICYDWAKNQIRQVTSKEKDV